MSNKKERTEEEREIVERELSLLIELTMRLEDELNSIIY
jgi:hypothetical protein